MTPIKATTEIRVDMFLFFLSGKGLRLLPRSLKARKPNAVVRLQVSTLDSDRRKPKPVREIQMTALKIIRKRAEQGSNDSPLLKFRRQLTLSQARELWRNRMKAGWRRAEAHPVDCWSYIH